MLLHDAARQPVVHTPTHHHHHHHHHQDHHHHIATTTAANTNTITKGATTTTTTIPAAHRHDTTFPCKLGAVVVEVVACLSSSGSYTFVCFLVHL